MADTEWSLGVVQLLDHHSSVSSQSFVAS